MTSHTSLPNWYPSFQHLTLKTHFIPLSSEFISFLKEDGIRFCGDDDNRDAIFLDDVPEEDDMESTSASDSLIPFKSLQQEIMNIRCQLSTKYLFPKLNWSCPKDACYMTSYNTPKIDSIEELFRMLKASDFVAYDLGKCQELHQEPVLCLRKHYDVRLSTEFRCFVQHGELVAISQRDMTNYYKFLTEDADMYRQEIQEFFNEHIKDKFQGLDSYVVDLYKSRTDKWWIVDFNEWGLPTHPLMFETWEKLEEDIEKAKRNREEDDNTTKFPIMRILSQQPVMQPSFQQYSGMPIDLARVENINEFLEELQKQELQKRQEGVHEEEKKQ